MTLINPITPIFLPDMKNFSYHADPCEAPSLSASMASSLLTQTPRHVWHDSRRLNPDFMDEDTSDAMDKGTLMHDLVLLGEETAVFLDFPDYRTNKAKEARDAAINDGKIPLLTHKWPPYKAMRDALFLQLAQHEEHPEALKGGKFEASLFWQKDGVNKRCRFDHVNLETDWIDDYKTTGTSIDQWIRGQLFSERKYLSDPHYSEGFEALTGRKPKGYRYIVQESFAPYCVAVVMLDNHSRQIAVEQLSYATNLWKQCLAENKWEGYARKTHWAEIPAYIEGQWEDKKLNDEAAKEAA